MNARIAVVGSVNLDIVAKAERLPVAGETVTDASLHRYPGGKGANQALAAKRLGAEVALFACVGKDAAADEALALLREGGVNLDGCQAVAEATGTALIAVSASGENQIVVAPGANRCLTADAFAATDYDAVICQLEVPIATLESVCRKHNGALVCMNLAPAMSIPDALVKCADLVVVNETEAQFYGEALRRNSERLVVTRGGDGADLYENGERVASAAPPAVEVADTTGAGDTFTAALTVALVEGMAADAALRFACTAGALATTTAGAQPSLPLRAAVNAAMNRA